MLIDERDVINLMRHAFLLGTNCGGSVEKIEAGLEERDEYIKELIDDYKETGYMDYGCDLGSHGHCPPSCK